MRILQGFASISKSMLKMETGQFSTRKWGDIVAVSQIGDLRNRLRGDESFSGDGAGLALEGKSGQDICLGSILSAGLR